jgi:hypothetical protein
VRKIRINRRFVAGAKTVRPLKTVVVARAQAEAYVGELEEQLATVGDDAQLANVDLQNILQKQQQTLLMMSNVSKMLHDTAKAVIRKIGG